MNNVFSDLLDVCIVVYLDDILIYSDDITQHRSHIKEVLKRLRKAGLYAKVEKCEFYSDSIEYLGYVLSPSGLTMSDAKVKTIQKWPEPKKVKDIQSFLGFANFYRRFIFNYSDIVIPLTHLTRKNTLWNFDDNCKIAFNTLKQAFTSTPILTHWVPDAQLVVETDASDYALAAILSIMTKDNEIHPVAFHSRTFSAPELNYNIHDKELLAIFEAFKIWRHYLEGSASPIDVVTDHKNLEYFSTTKILTRQQARWLEYLSQFNLVIRFHPGYLGTKPDTLTRQWDVYPKRGDNGYTSVNPHNFRLVFTHKQIAASLRATILTTPTLRAATILDLNQLYSDILATLSLNTSISDHLLYLEGHWLKDSTGFLRLDNRMYVPDNTNLRLRVLQYYHDHVLAGHLGQNKTLELIRRHYTWPNICDDVQKFCKSCVICMRSKPQRHRPYGSLQQLPIPERPWNSISMDFIEKLPSSSGFDTILVIVDHLSKQAIFIPTHDTITSAELARLFMIHVFSKHRVPSHVTSDHGSEFVSHFFHSLGTALDMRLYFTSGYHPEANGQAEWTNQTLEQYLCIYCNYQQDNWSELLPLAEFAYNNAPSATTGVSSFFANKGYHPNLSVYPEQDIASSHTCDFVLNLDELQDTLKEKIAKAQRQYQPSANSRQ